MAHTTYDSRTFHVGVLPGGLEKEARTLIRYAVDLGWKVMVKHITVKLYPPNKAQRPTITISASNNSIPYRQHLKKIDKYGSALIPRAADAETEDQMEKVAQATADRIKVREQAVQQREESAVKWEEPPPAEPGRKKANAGFKAEQEKRRAERGDTDPREVTDVADEGKAAINQMDDDALKELIETEVANAEKVSGPDPKPKKKRRPQSKKDPIAPERKVGAVLLREGPMIAYAANDKGYPSPTTIERVWRDTNGEEFIDYRCPYCKVTSDFRHGMRSHYRTHVRAGEAPEFDQDSIPKIVVAPHDPVYNPRTSRIEALKIVLLDLLKSGLSWDDLDNAAETLARTSLEWQHAQTGGSLAAEREPMTAEETLVRIRSLVDNGMYEKQVDQIRLLEEQAQKQAERMETLEISVTTAEAQARDARETLSTFRALINEQVPEAG